MTSYTYSCREALINGLRTSEKVRSGKEFLKSCFGWKPSPEGLEGPEVITFPVDGHSVTDYTQLIDGEQSYLFDYSSSEAKLYPLNTSYAKGSDVFTSGVLPDAYTDTGSIAISATNKHMFDSVQADTYGLFTNGDSFFIKHNGLYTSWAAINPAVNKIPSSLCMIGKQLIVGGFEGNATFWENSSYPGLRLWAQARQWGEGFSATYIQKSIFVGRPNSLEGLSPFVPEIITLTGRSFTAHQEFVENLIHNGGMKFIMIPWEGKILRVKTLGDKVIVYGDQGTGIYLPNDGAIIQLTRNAIAGRDAVGGDEQGHVFIDRDDYVWYLSADLQLTKLGFQEYAEELTNVKVVFNPLKREYYLTGTECFSLTKELKLYESYYKPTSLLTSHGNLYGVVALDGSDTYYFETSETSFNRRGQKRIGALELQQLNCTDLLGKINARVGSNTYSLSGIRFNQEDVGWGFCVGTDFSFFVQGKSGESGTIDDLQVKWQSGDGRTVRGLTGGEGNGYQN